MFAEVDKRGREEVALWVYFYRRRRRPGEAAPNEPLPLLRRQR